ncbi:PSMC3, partial [Symbiodinium sp. CCMP2456]
MAAPLFDDDLFDFSLEAEGEDSAERGSAESAGPDDSASLGAGAADDMPSQGSGRRRKRGSRGGAQASAEHRWRSGAVPPAPEFSGDVERDPYCLRHYRRRLLRWVKITKEFLPANEQALRALEKLTGEAELEFEEVPDDRFDHPDGISRLLGDLDKAFGEREIFRQGGVIREFESIGRMQGESITAFIRRFRLLERKLAENKIPEYPEQARVIKLLDGLRLDEKATASILLAAGNKYQMQTVLEALRIQYPPGMSITGLPKGLTTLSSRSTRSSSSRASTFKSSATSGNRKSQGRFPGSKWTQWHTEWDGGDGEQAPEGEDEHHEEYQDENPENAEPNHEDVNEEDEDEELVPEFAEDQYGNEEAPEDVSALLAAAEALTVTSKKLAGLVQSRGFYVEGRGKGFPSGKAGGKKGGKGKTKSQQGRGKSKGKDFKGKGKGVSSGKSNGDRQMRLKGSLCLGCGASDHWIRDCPHVTQFQAQMASAEMELDPEGAPVAVSWMVTSHAEAVEEKVEVFKVPRPPAIMLSTCEDASFLIADTGCQRQVAGSVWHRQKCNEIQPLVPLRFEEVCRYSFGPSNGMPSKARYLYPAGIAGETVFLAISEVEAPAPGLLSRRTMEALGAVPDLLEGEIYFKALGKSTCLYLSPCGHLALKIDEWPSSAFEWPGQYSSMQFTGQDHPAWLENWRMILVHLQEFIYTTQMAVLYYSAATLRPKLKDSVLKLYMEPCSAVTMMGTQAAMAATNALQLNRYPKSPAKCDHTHGTGTRTYAAGGMRIRICDACGSRWVLTLTGEALEAVPKANPNAKTGLGLTDSQKQRLAQAKTKAKQPSPAQSSASDASWQRLSASSQVPSQAKARTGLRPPPPPRQSWGPQSQSPSLFRMNGQRMPPRQWHSARSTAGSDTDMSVDTAGGRPRRVQGPRDFRPGQPPEGEELTPEEIDAILMSQRDDPSLWRERMDRDDWEPDDMNEMSPELRREFEDKGCFLLKNGVKKRLLGSAKAVLQAWETEAVVYANRAHLARKLRDYSADILELDPVVPEISEMALIAGLRVLEPVGLLDAAAQGMDVRVLRKLIKRRRPFVVVCRVPSLLEPGDHGDYSDKVCQLLHEMLDQGTHFWMRANKSEEFLSGLRARQLQSAPGVRTKVCQHVLYMTDLPEFFEEAAKLGDEMSSVSETKVIISALQEALQRRGDERWNQNWYVNSGLPGDDEKWICEAYHGSSLDNFELLWEPPGEPRASVFFLDINRHEDSWKPLLEEAEQRLKNLTTNGVTLKPSPYLERVKSLVPWKLQRVQIFRAPKQRRLPNEVSQEGTQHRGAALLHNDDTVVLEAEKISSIIQAPTGKFGKPVRIAIFFYGDAPVTSLNEQDNELPEQPKPKPEAPGGDPQDQMRPHQPGYRDISFPGVELPAWLKQAPRRSEGIGACTFRRFNDRLSMDIIYLKDVRGGTHMFLNLVDDATCYQAASRLMSRSEENVVANLINGWFCYFGPPDELTIDAEGAFRGMRFEALHAQLNVDVRCIPPDSHWQLGKAERHGQALRYNATRLINQFAALTVAEVNICVASAVQAKNRLMRRSGSSPNQWVYGRDPKLPGSLLSDGGSIESAQLISDSEKLMQIESLRTQSMINHHEYEASQALRAALLRKSRPYRGEFYPGQKVAYYRKRTATGDGEGTLEGYRQGVVLSLDRNPSSNIAANLWIRNSRGRLVQASPEQCRPIFGEEEWWTPDPQDLEVLRKFDKDLQLHPRAFRHEDRPGPAADRRLAEDLAEDAAADAARSTEPRAEEPLQAQPGTPVVLEDESEQAPKPAPLTLDPAGRPVLESPMFSPMMFIPPTPRKLSVHPSVYPN